MTPIVRATLLTPSLVGVVLDSAALSRLVEKVAFADRDRETPSLTVTLVHAGAPALGDASGRAFAARRVMRIELADGTVQLWRVRSATESATDTSAPTAQLVPLWLDIEKAVARFASGAVADGQVSLTGRTPAETLAQILDPANGAPRRADGQPMYVLGTVDALVASRRADVVATGSTVLGLLEALGAAADCSYRLRVVGGATPAEDVYAVDLLALVTSEDVVPVATIGNRALARGGQTDLPGFPRSARPNTARLDRTEDIGDLSTVIVPSGAGDVLAGAALWRVSAAAFNAVANTTALTVETPEAALGLFAGELPVGLVVADGALVGYAVQRITSSEVSEPTWDIEATTQADPSGASIVVVAGDARALNGARVRVLEASGHVAVAVEHPALVAAYGRIETTLATAIPSQPEILSEAGITTDLSAWEGSGASYRPRGWNRTTAYGDVVFERVTDPGLIIAGTASARVTIPPHAGIGGSDEIVVGPLVGTVLDRPEYGAALSVFLAIRVLSGRVRIWLTGTSAPAEFTLGPTVGGVAGGVFDTPTILLTADKLVGALPLQLRMENAATDAPAVFVVDSLTAVRAPQAQPYAPLSGPRGIWLAGVREARAQAVAGVEAWESSFFDLSALGFAGQAPVRPGAVVRVEPDGLPGGLARVAEARWEDVIPAAPELARSVVDAEVRLGRPRVPLQARLTAGTPSLYGETASGSGTGAASGTGSSGGNSSGSSGVPTGAVPTSRTITLGAGTGLAVAGGTQTLESDRTWTVAPAGYLLQSALDGRYLNAASNLSDLASTETARTNLDVYSKAEVYTKAEVVPKTGGEFSGAIAAPDVIATVGVQVGTSVGGRFTHSSYGGADGSILVTNLAGNADGHLIVGKLTITTGDIDQYNMTELLVRDQYIVVNAGQTGPILNGGLRVERGSAADAYLTWEEGGDLWGTKMGPTGGFQPFARTNVEEAITAAWTFGAGVRVRADNSGVVVDDAFSAPRVGLMKYAGRTAGIWRTAGIGFEIGRVAANSLLDAPGAMTVDLAIDGSGYVYLGQQAVSTGGAVRADRTVTPAASNLGFVLTGGGDLTANRTLGVTPPQDLRVTGTPEFARVGAGRAAHATYALDAAGTSRLASGVLTGTLSAETWTSGLTGWGVTVAGNADFRLITADELRVKAFTADVAQALVGSTILSKSRGIVSAPFTVPAAGATATLVVDDLETLPGIAVFTSGDTVLLRVIDRTGGGLAAANVWGKVTNYSQQAGRQTWTFTRATGSTGSVGSVVNKGSVVVDYGVPGDSLIIATVLDAVAKGYEQMHRWYDDNADGVPDRYEVDFRLGDLNGISRPGLGALSAAGLFTDRLYAYNSATDYLRIDAAGLALRLGGREVITASTLAGITTLRLGGDGVSNIQIAASQIEVAGLLNVTSSPLPDDSALHTHITFNGLAASTAIGGTVVNGRGSNSTVQLAPLESSAVGAVGRSARFTGQSRLALGTPLSSTSYSISFWIKRDSAAAPQQFKSVVSSNVGSETHHILLQGWTVVCYNPYAGGGEYAAGYEIPDDGRFHHIVFTASAFGSGSFYADGAFHNAAAVAAPNLAVTPITHIGGHATYNTYPSGNLDEVRLYTRALSPAEVRALYLNPAGGGGMTQIDGAVIRVGTGVLIDGNSGRINANLVDANTVLAQQITVSSGTPNQTVRFNQVSESTVWGGAVWAMQAGYTSPTQLAPFALGYNGILFASNATIRGHIEADTGYFRGTLQTGTAIATAGQGLYVDGATFRLATTFGDSIQSVGGLMRIRSRDLEIEGTNGHTGDLAMKLSNRMLAFGQAADGGGPGYGGIWLGLIDDGVTDDAQLHVGNLHYAAETLTVSGWTVEESRISSERFNSKNGTVEGLTFLDSNERRFGVQVADPGGAYDAISVGDFDVAEIPYSPVVMNVTGTWGTVFGSGGTQSGATYTTGTAGTWLFTMTATGVATEQVRVTLNLNRVSYDGNAKTVVTIELEDQSGNLLTRWVSTGAGVSATAAPIHLDGRLVQSTSQLRVRVAVSNAPDGLPQSSTRYALTPVAAARYNRTVSQYGRDGISVYNSPTNRLLMTTAGLNIAASSFRTAGLVVTGGIAPAVASGEFAGVLFMASDGLPAWRMPDGTVRRFTHP